MVEKTVVYKASNGKYFSTEKLALGHETDLALLEFFDKLGFSNLDISVLDICHYVKSHKKELMEYLLKLDDVEFCGQRTC